MKILKKISYIILVVALLSSQVITFDIVEGNGNQSLNDIKKEHEALKAEYAQNQAEKEATEDEMSAAEKEIARISSEKEDLEKEIEELEEEIAQLEKDIITKNEEMKGIVSYYQLSSGEDAYLEYLFTSADFTDFIYRMAIAEQLSDYNEALIDEYNELITQNEAKKEEASKKIIELDKKTEELENKVSELNVELKENMEGAIDIKAELKEIESQIKDLQEMYDRFKCDYNMSSDDCILKAIKEELYATKFYRPLNKGRVSSNWGNRTFKLNGRWVSDFHYGIDLSASHGTKVYPAANGQVVRVVNAKSSYSKDGKKVCGGNQVYIAHIVNGKKYTTAYMHLATIKVKKHDLVTSNTVIGTVGGSPSIEYWDNCSTGSHLHFQVANGHYYLDYMTYSKFTSKSFNPRKVLSFPSLGSSFSGRG